MPTTLRSSLFPKPSKGTSKEKGRAPHGCPPLLPLLESVVRRGGSAGCDRRGADLPGIRSGVGIGERALRRGVRRGDLKGHYAGGNRGSEYVRIRLERAENPCR